MAAVYGDDGKLLGFAKIMRDNTGLREAQEALREAKDKLDQRVRERTAELEAVIQELEDFNYSVEEVYFV